MTRLRDVAIAIFNANPALGWSGIAPYYVGTGQPTTEPSRRLQVRDDIESQVVDALTFFAGWVGPKGFAVTLAASASMLAGKEVSAAAIIVSAEIAGLSVRERGLVVNRREGRQVALVDRVEIARVRARVYRTKFPGSDLV